MEGTNNNGYPANNFQQQQQQQQKLQNQNYPAYAYVNPNPAPPQYASQPYAAPVQSYAAPAYQSM